MVIMMIAVLCMTGCSRMRVVDAPVDSAIPIDKALVRGQDQQDAKPDVTQNDVKSAAKSSSSRSDGDGGGSASERAQTPSPNVQTAQQSSSPSAAVSSPKAKKSSSDKTTGTKEGPSKKKKTGDAGEKTKKTGDKGEKVDKDTEAQEGSGSEETKRDGEAEPAAPSSEEVATAIRTRAAQISGNHQSVYPCQASRLYCELEEDYKAASWKSSKVIDGAIAKTDAINIGSSKNDMVSISWLVSLGEGVGTIIKIVDSETLGSASSDENAAVLVQQSIAAREGYNQLDAVKDGRIIVASRDLFSTQAGVMLFELYVAMSTYPDLYADLYDAGGIAALQAELMPGDANAYFYPAEPPH